MGKVVLQDWVLELPFMQQTVLLTAVRGPDGLPKYGPVKMLLRWYRRCFLVSALDGRVLETPHDPAGGSFTGPSIEYPGVIPANEKGVLWEGPMDDLVGEYLRLLDALPHHFHMHFMHGAEIIGFKHPNFLIRGWWCRTYHRFVRDMHLRPETRVEMDRRLGDNRSDWLESNDPATVD